MTASALHPAATLILIRERAESAPELLMIQRSAAMAFGAGAWVFPGGRVDPGDNAHAAATLPSGADPDDHAGRIAAIRETIEEAGVAVGLHPAPGPETLLAIRAGLHAGEPFAALLDRFGLRLMTDRLLSFSRWQPPATARIRFDTRFYVARAPEATLIVPDGAETVAACWATASEMIGRADYRLMFPTLCNLQRIATQATFDDLAAHAAAFPSRLIIPETCELDGQRWLFVPDGHGYPEIRMLVAATTRG